jgi:hypothetical protein
LRIVFPIGIVNIYGKIQFRTPPHKQSLPELRLLSKKDYIHPDLSFGNPHGIANKGKGFHMI